MVPGKLTIYEAASALGALIIIFVGTCFVLLVIVGYAVLAYAICPGKARNLRYY